MNLRRVAPVVLLAAVPLAAAACGGSSGSSTAGSVPGSTAAAGAADDDLGTPLDWRGQKEVTVEVSDNKFDQKAIMVSPGTKVTWKNIGHNNHNATPKVEGDFEFVQLNVGESGSATFGNEGTVYYYCTIHSGADRGPQRGKVVVATGKPTGTAAP